MHQFCTISKVEERPDGTLHVEGIASSEAVDSDGEVIKSDAMSKALPDFFRHGTGALREMHQPIAAGRVDKAEVGADGQTTIAATVVDPVAITKVKAGVYKGFSIGGRVTARDTANKNVITGLKLTEISLVDRPANPLAVLTLVKVDPGEVGLGEVGRGEVDRGGPVAKVGARHSRADFTHLQAIHDHAVRMGARCPGCGPDHQNQSGRDPHQDGPSAPAGTDATTQGRGKADGPPPGGPSPDGLSPDGLSPVGLSPDGSCPEGAPDWVRLLERRDAALAALDALTAKVAGLNQDLRALGGLGRPAEADRAGGRPQAAGWRVVSKGQDSLDEGGFSTPPAGLAGATAIDAIRKAHRQPQRLI